MDIDVDYLDDLDDLVGDVWVSPLIETAAHTLSPTVSGTKEECIFTSLGVLTHVQVR